MKKYLPFILIAGAGALLFFGSMAGAGRKIKVYFQSLKFGKVKGLSVPDVFAIFRIVNPTNTTLTVNSFQADMFVNDKYFGNIQNLTKTDLPANAETLYEVKIQLSVISVAVQLIQILRKKEKIKITYTGTVNVAGIVLPVNETVYQ